MNRFDLNALGVSEMSQAEMLEVDGGFDPVDIGLLLCAIFSIGYMMGADRAAMDR